VNKQTGSLLIGMVEITVGRAAHVVKVHILLAARALPARFLAPVVMVAVYNELGTRTAGVKVAVRPE